MSMEEQRRPIADPRFPIGPFSYPQSVSAEDRESFLARIEAVPGRLRAVVSGLSDAQLDQPYRTGGWTVRQVVHHIPDSHMNSYIRFKWALTEDTPLIKPYDEKAWALLPDTFAAPPETSLRLLENLHSRWAALLRSLTEEQWGRTMLHPVNGPLRLDQALALYAWHGDHHIAHIQNARLGPNESADN